MQTLRRFFDDELDLYRAHIIEMLKLARQLLDHAVDGLLLRRLEVLGDLKRFDAELDRLEIEIDAEAVRYLNLRAPVASELRLILAGSRMGHELERMGDEAKKIAKRARRGDASKFPEFIEPFRQMADTVHGMINSVLHAFDTPGDVSPTEIIARDAQVDDLNRELCEKIILVIQQEPILLRQGFDLIACSKALERIGDHTKNLAEILVFMSTGQDIRDASISPSGK